MKVIMHDGSIEEHSFDEEIGRGALRHTASHILAQAVKRLFPETKLAIGPSIKDGFYYDFDRDGGFSNEDIAALEAEMKKVVKENLKLERFTLPRAEAIKLMQEKNEPYKVELIEDLPEDEELSFFKQGEYVDLCAGPHVTYTSAVKAFKLTSVAGAYWRGSEKNKMLTRIYGTAFSNKTDLDEYLTRLEEAKKRDHRRIGKEMGLFMMSEEGPRLPVLPSQRNDSKEHSYRLLASDTHPRGLCRGIYSDDTQPPPLGDLRSLGSLQAEHVHNCYR